jgi:sterol desaturase/sphingolipid hydroxylase (fatty acid hydroxylase superfamily)
MRDEPGGGPQYVPRAAVLRASPPMFRSPWLDRLTRVHPAVPAVMYGPAILLLTMGALVRDMSDRRMIVSFVCGYLLWTLCEYWVHRALFHFEPEEGFGARLHWMIHGVHHDHPSDPRRLVLPPALSLPFALIFLGLFVVALGTPTGWAACAGFFAGYLAYDMVHFALHHHRPRSRLGRRFHELHMRHHFEDDERGFGVSAPWWDIVFGTYSPRGRARSGARSHE